MKLRMLLSHYQKMLITQYSGQAPQHNVSRLPRRQRSSRWSSSAFSFLLPLTIIRSWKIRLTLFFPFSFFHVLESYHFPDVSSLPGPHFLRGTKRQRRDRHCLYCFIFSLIFLHCIQSCLVVSQGNSILHEHRQSVWSSLMRSDSSYPCTCRPHELP